MSDKFVRDFFKSRMGEVEFREHLARLKRRIQADVFTAAKTCRQHKRLKGTLSDLIEKMTTIPAGRRLLERLPQTTAILSVPHLNGDESTLGECIASMEVVNVFPETLLSNELGEADKMEVLGHECFHVVHHKMQKALALQANGMFGDLNAYDIFFLDLLDEAGAFLGGEEIGMQAGGALAPENIADFFFKQTSHYLENYFTHVLKGLRQAGMKDIKEVQTYFATVHSPLYYQIQRAYFELHPALADANLLSRAHHSFKQGGRMVTELLKVSSVEANRIVNALASENLSLPQVLTQNAALIPGRRNKKAIVKKDVMIQNGILLQTTAHTKGN